MWKRIAIATPLIILALSIVFAESYRAANNHGPRSNGETLQLMGYNYNRQLVQLSVTLWNIGDKPITIKQVFYDDMNLTKGLIGSAVDHTVIAKDSGQKHEGIIATNDLIFAAADQWNMDTIGPNSPIIQPKGIASLFLGVTANDSGSRHLLRIIAEGEQHEFTLEFRSDEKTVSTHTKE
ncbi:MAG: hypothetical protein HYU39_09710 [Thaumarchaeota archaeon]|nr:hypothetical protein [Nitrososphaerota archaeon]